MQIQEYVPSISDTDELPFASLDEADEESYYQEHYEEAPRSRQEIVAEQRGFAQNQILDELNTVKENFANFVTAVQNQTPQWMILSYNPYSGNTGVWYNPGLMVDPREMLQAAYGQLEQMFAGGDSNRE